MSNDASLEGGSYDVIRKRLLDQATLLGSKAEALNDERKKVFGGSELVLVANERVRTEHSCIVRDIVSVSGRLLFGFQVFLGLKAEVSVKDAFGLYAFERPVSGAPTGGEGDAWKLEEVPFEGKGAFLAEEAFAKDLRDTFRYAKDARLLRLKRTETRLLASVQVGASTRDVKVLRWVADGGGRLRYLDARGEEDLAPPRQHDFAWKQTGREDQVAGKHPHVSVLDTVFVETIGGDLTIKVENNTKDGRGIYREPVDDPNQTLDDSDIAYAQVGQLILLRIKPFREASFRYLVFDKRAGRVVRVDAIGLACHALAEDHGIIFPGGYYLQSGEHKLFDGDVSDLFFERMVKAPNGEDVLFVYHHHDRGEYLLLPYNAIRKDVANPIRCHGFSLFDDGTMAVVRAVDEPTRVHPLQIWRTPFATVEHAAAQPKGDSYLAKVGNADLVRGISDALSIRKLAQVDKPTRGTFEDLVASVTRAVDAHYWLGHEGAHGLRAVMDALKSTALLVLDEFDKVEAIEKRAREALAEAEDEQTELLKRVRPDDLRVVDDFLRALTTLKSQRGKLISLKDLRGVDLTAIERLEKEIAAQFDAVSAACVTFFLAENAFGPLLARLDEVVKKVEVTQKASDLAAFAPELDLVQDGLTLLAEVVAGLRIDDATARTRILEGISAAFAQQNRARAVFQAKKKDLSLSEGRAEFGAQFRLFGQSVTGALARCDTPEACDEQLSKLLLALEELEGRFGELDAFSAELIQKREEVTDALGARRQQLLDERNRRAEGLVAAADRILAGVGRRVQTFATASELNAYFASDAMVQKLTDIQSQLAALGETVREGAIASRIKSARQDALRTLRDKADMFEAGSNVIKLGEHRFAVHTQPLELALVPRDDAMYVHLTGTDFFETIVDPVLDASRDLWERTLVSESRDVYRGEYLAASMLLEAEEGKGTHGGEPASVARLEAAARDGTLEALVRAVAQERLDEGYERGIHDHDTAKILERLLALRSSAGLLRFSSLARTLAVFHWASLPGETREPGAPRSTSPRALLHARARGLGRLAHETGHARGQAALAAELVPALEALAKTLGLPASAGDLASAARVLVLELGAPQVRFTASEAAFGVARDLLASLDARGNRRAFEDEVRALDGHPREQLALTVAYVEAFAPTSPHVTEAAAMLLTDRSLVSGVALAVERSLSAATVEARVTGLLGVHPRIEGQAMDVAIDTFLARVVPFVTDEAPRFRAFRQQKLHIVERERARLRLAELAPKVLTSFVRNRLIDKVYLPLVGANLAKQLGAAGAKKRTDLMGLLLLVSPPGYGKTTLMEYVASKLGLVFLKVNGPAIGHEVTSLDPADAKTATARQEVEKINLAFEMGQNVMLYLDDIQHVSSELLQKFISLCDAQRRIEGVWKGQSRTYDLRGKKFCVVMAGNPYTETGARFEIPDMLANRADTYNLGDILGGAEDLFAASYVENALTSNSVLAPLATRPPEDLFKLMAMARGESVPLTDLSHGYSAAEVEEITAVLKHLARVQAVLLEVNRQYIASASQDDAYRTEPPFKLQGSYRNMNKLTEKVVSAMNEAEIEALVDDHYASESQTLTAGAEQSLLKLAELRGRMSDAQRARWKEIKEAYVRTRRTGGKGDDPVTRVTGALSGLDAELGRIREAIAGATAPRETEDPLAPVLTKLDETLRGLARPKVQVSLEDGGGAAASALLDVVRQQGHAMERALRGVLEALSSVRSTAPAAQPSSPAVASSQIEELVSLVRGLDVRLASVQSSAHRVEVVLDGTSASNLYRGLDGQDVIAHGGLFVATYAKPPALGAPVVVGITMPGGVRFDVGGVVSFVQDDIGEASPAGFGVRITSAPPDARAFFEQFANHREPLVRD